MKNQPATARHSRLGAIQGRLAGMCLILIVVGLGLLFRLPAQSVAMAEQRQSDVEFREFADLFSEIYGRIKTQYVDDVDSKKLFEGAINGMFTQLDPHSSWLPPEQQEMLTKDTEGEYSGVGLHITLDERRILTVLLPILGSPAARAGVQPWDRIVEIEGKSTEGLSLNDAVKQLTGPQGSEVNITVWRPGTPKLLPYTLRREEIKVKSVFSKMFEDKIGYLRIVKFQDDTAHAVQAALETLNQQEARGLIVDLRYNAGGLLDRVQEISDMFLEKNMMIVATKGRTAKDNKDYYSLNDPIFTKPIIVLVNEFSASASEILAGAVQDNHRGVVMGPKDSHTYGKASVQTISMLQNSMDVDANGNTIPSGLRLTTARYFTPAGRMIMDKGIVPDIGIEFPAGHELELRQHGLLGDPNTLESDAVPSEPKAADGPTTDTAQPGADDDEDPTGRMVKQLEEAHEQITGTTAEKPADEKPAFRDVLLDEAVKYLKAILIFEGDRKAA